MTDDQKGWGEYRLLIISELERFNSTVLRIEEKIEKFRQEDLAQIKQDVVVLKFQAAMWGAIAGAVLTAGLGLAARFIR